MTWPETRDDVDYRTRWETIIKMELTVTGTGRVVEGIWGDESATVQWPGEHKLDLANPLLDGFSLRLRLLSISLEEVWEVSVQVIATSVMPEINTIDS